MECVAIIDDDTIFTSSDLSKTDLSKLAGLQPHRLNGANLSGAKLSNEITESLKEFVDISDAAKLSKNLYMMILLACVFCWLIIAQVKDVDLFTDRNKAKLPVVGVEIPMKGFFFAAPAILFSVYTYFHLQLRLLWEAICRAPAVYPDGQTVDQKYIHGYYWSLFVSSLLDCHGS